jgi:hypothetical protein
MVMSRITNHSQEYSPSVSPQSKRQMFARRGDRLMSACHSIPFALAELSKAKSIKFIGVWIDSLICMSGTGRDGNECACGNRHTIGKCERAQCKAAQGHWENVAHTSVFRSWTLKKESNEQRPRPSSRWDSRRKLSILCILSIPAFVQPSSATTASTSWRRGSTYSGCARRRYNSWVRVY